MKTETTRHLSRAALRVYFWILKKIKIRIKASSAVTALLSGNHVEAEQLAKKFTHRQLREAYQLATGCTENTAIAAADFMQGDRKPY